MLNLSQLVSLPNQPRHEFIFMQPHIVASGEAAVQAAVGHGFYYYWALYCSLGRW